MGLVVPGSSNQRVQALKSVWAFNFHFPIVIFTRTKNSDVPCSISLTQDMLNDRDDLGALPGIARVLHFDGHCH
jgi:hypothetical protein